MGVVDDTTSNIHAVRRLRATPSTLAKGISASRLTLVAIRPPALKLPPRKLRCIVAAFSPLSSALLLRSLKATFSPNCASSRPTNHRPSNNLRRASRGATPFAPTESRSRHERKTGPRLGERTAAGATGAGDKFGAELTETDAKFFAAVAANEWADLPFLFGRYDAQPRKTHLLVQESQAQGRSAHLALHEFRRGQAGAQSWRMASRRVHRRQNRSVPL